MICPEKPLTIICPIHWAGSIRDGEIATVKSIDPEKKMATVWFHNESIEEIKSSQKVAKK